MERIRSCADARIRARQYAKSVNMYSADMSTLESWTQSCTCMPTHPTTHVPRAGRHGPGEQQSARGAPARTLSDLMGTHALTYARVRSCRWRHAAAVREAPAEQRPLPTRKRPIGRLGRRRLGGRRRRPRRRRRRQPCGTASAPAVETASVVMVKGNRRERMRRTGGGRGCVGGTHLELRVVVVAARHGMT
jgi:hypothetical protein